MSQKNTLQDKSEIERNPIGLPTLSAKEIADVLDVLVASLSTQYHQYLKHHWVVEGPEHRDLHHFFEEAYMETQRHFDAIAERMTTLGAVPTASMRGLANKSLLEAESEGVFPVRDMLRRDLENEQEVLKFLGHCISKAMDLSDYGTEVLLKRIIAERQERAHELDHYLSSDSLVRPTETLSGVHGS